MFFKKQKEIDKLKKDLHATNAALKFEKNFRNLLAERLHEAHAKMNEACELLKEELEQEE